MNTTITNQAINKTLELIIRRQLSNESESDHSDQTDNSTSVSNSSNPGYLDSNVVWASVFLFACLGVWTFSRFLYSTRPLIENKPTDVDLAIARCREQAQDQKRHLDIINKELENYTQEGRALTSGNSNQVKHSIFTPPTENTPLVLSVDRGNCAQLFAELQELMNNYPALNVDNNSSREAFDLYYKDCEDHHHEVVSRALILLPNYRALINEARIPFEQRCISKYKRCE